MTKRLVLLAYLIVGIGALQWGCNDWDLGDNNCSPSPLYRVHGIDTTRICIFSDGIPQESSIDTILHDSIVFKVYFNTEAIAKHPIPIGNSAYALTCKKYRVDKRIERIQIYLIDYNNEEMTTRFSFNGKDVKRFDDYREHTWSDFETDFVGQFRVKFWPSKYPASRIKFVYTFSDHSTLESITRKVKLL